MLAEWKPVAPADPVVKALDRARATWMSGCDGRRLRRICFI
jgi:hypothetical protein